MHRIASAAATGQSAAGASSRTRLEQIGGPASSAPGADRGERLRIRIARLPEQAPGTGRRRQPACSPVPLATSSTVPRVRQAPREAPPRSAPGCAGRGGMTRFMPSTRRIFSFARRAFRRATLRPGTFGGNRDDATHSDQARAGARRPCIAPRRRRRSRRRREQKAREQQLTGDPQIASSGERRRRHPAGSGDAPSRQGLLLPPARRGEAGAGRRLGQSARHRRRACSAWSSRPARPSSTTSGARSSPTSRPAMSATRTRPRRIMTPCSPSMQEGDEAAQRRSGPGRAIRPSIWSAGRSRRPTIPRSHSVVWARNVQFDGQSGEHAQLRRPAARPQRRAQPQHDHRHVEARRDPRRRGQVRRARPSSSRAAAMPTSSPATRKPNMALPAWSPPARASPSPRSSACSASSSPSARSSWSSSSRCFAGLGAWFRRLFGGGEPRGANTSLTAYEAPSRKSRRAADQPADAGGGRGGAEAANSPEPGRAIPPPRPGRARFRPAPASAPPGSRRAAAAGRGPAPPSGSRRPLSPAPPPSASRR